VKCGFSVDDISSNDDNAVKFSEDKEDDWYSLQPLQVQFEDCATCGSALEVCGVQSVDQVLDQHLTIPEVEVAEYEATFLDALKGLEAT
jgi:MinD superfamily P-loop ATPase